MKRAISETDRRRAIQAEYNEKHGITPATVKRAIFDISPASGQNDYYAVPKGEKSRAKGEKAKTGTGGDIPSELELLERIQAVRQQMFAAAENLQFETAARLRDELRKLQTMAGDGVDTSNPLPPTRASERPAPKRRGAGAAGGRRKR
jgi:excinuclease ABC subunit B